MDRGKKLLSILAIVVLVTMSSCLCAPEPAEVGPGPVTIAPKPDVPAVTTTTVAVPAPAVAEVPVTPAAPAVVAPSISEVDLRNLFGQANSLRNDVANFRIAEVLPAEVAASEKQFGTAKVSYDAAMDANPYDEYASYPVKDRLEYSIATNTGILDRGLPLRVAVERGLALEKMAGAEAANASSKAPERMEAAGLAFADAEKLETNKSWPMAIDAYDQSAVMYDLAARRAMANGYRETIFSNGYATYSSNYFDIAEKKYAEEADLWESGSPVDLDNGVNALAIANTYYSEVIGRGREYAAYDHKAAANAAKKQSDGLNALVNAPDEYASALVNYNEGEANLKGANYETATLWYDEATQGYGQAYDISFAKSDSAEALIAQADDAVTAADDKAAYEKMSDNPYLKLARDYKANADVDFSGMYFDAASTNAQKAIDYAFLSNSYVDGKVAKAQADAKLSADASLVKAKSRMAWADKEGIKADYPAEYKQASAAMTAANLAYGNENFGSAKSNADEVVSVLSGDFEARVAADRAAKMRAAADKAAADKMAAEKARLEAERLAAEKTAEAKAMADMEAAKFAADISLARARGRKAWADKEGIKADYPGEYKNASAAMTAAEIAYDNESFVPAKANAEEVVSILSADFEAKVVADRAAKAAAKAAADKAVADKLAADMAAAKAKAEADKLAADKAAAEASANAARIEADRISAENARLAAERLVAEKNAAAEAERLANLRAAELKARADMEAARADADISLANARGRKAWADAAGIKTDYPAEYKNASAAMTAAEIAYDNESFVPAKANAEEVVSILSADFEARVVADRAAKAAAEKAAADKLAADMAAAKAKAEADKLAADKAAAEASANAARIEADRISAENARLAAERLVAEKNAAAEAERLANLRAAELKARADMEAARADADISLAKARGRKAWADAAGIKTDYPAEYKNAAAAMTAAEIAYDNESYIPAKANAEEVVSILSADFEAKVAADRAAKAKAKETPIVVAPVVIAPVAPVVVEPVAPIVVEPVAPIVVTPVAPIIVEPLTPIVVEPLPPVAVAPVAPIVVEPVAPVLPSVDAEKLAAMKAAELKAAADMEAAKAAADISLAKARERKAWADMAGIKADYPGEYKNASAAMTAAEIAYGNESYVPAKTNADEVVSILSGDFEARVNAERAAKLAAAEKAAADKAAADKAAADKASMEAARIAADKAAADKAAADKAAAEKLAAMKTDAEFALTAAQQRYGWASAYNAENNYPAEFGAASGYLKTARAASKTGDWATTKTSALSTIEALKFVKETAPLPASYTVRLIPARRDCLWRIAEYSFVYNNPLKWPVLYEANKKTFKDPSNPNLIYPGQVLIIPSIAGEVRKDMWNTAKTYSEFPKPTPKKK